MRFLTEPFGFNNQKPGSPWLDLDESGELLGVNWWLLGFIVESGGLQEFTRHVFGPIQKVSDKTKKVLFWGTWKEWNGAKTVVANKSDLDDDYGKDCGGGKHSSIYTVD